MADKAQRNRPTPAPGHLQSTIDSRSTYPAGHITLAGTAAAPDAAGRSPTRSTRAGLALGWQCSGLPDPTALREIRSTTPDSRRPAPARPRWSVERRAIEVA